MKYEKRDSGLGIRDWDRLPGCVATTACDFARARLPHHANRRNLSIAARRRPPDGRREHLRAHGRLQPALPLLRYALRLVDARGRRAFGDRDSRSRRATPAVAAPGVSGRIPGRRLVRASSPVRAILLPPISKADDRTRHVRHVVLTGGEPMLFADLVPLAAELRDRGWHITIETAGTLYLPVACDLMSISPKLSNSTPTAERASALGAASRAASPRARRDSPADRRVRLPIEVRDRLPGRLRRGLGLSGRVSRDRTIGVMLMPQGIDAETLAEKAFWLEPYCAAHGFTFCPRRQIEWFGPERGR